MARKMLQGAEATDVTPVRECLKDPIDKLHLLLRIYASSNGFKELWVIRQENANLCDQVETLGVAYRTNTTAFN